MIVNKVVYELMKLLMCPAIQCTFNWLWKINQKFNPHVFKTSPGNKQVHI